jgi:hypothetical protein
MGIAATNRGALSTTEIALAIAALLILIGLAISFSPGVFRVLIPLGIVAVVAVLSAPAPALTAAFLGRLVVDLSHQVMFGGTNLMVFYSGAVVFLAGLFVWMNFQKTMRHPLIVPVVLYVTLMLISGVRSSSIVMWANVFARQMGPLMMLVLFFGLYTGKPYFQRSIPRLVVLTSTIPIISGIWAYWNGDLIFSVVARLQGGYKNIHNTAHIMALFAVFALFQASVTKRAWERIGYLIIGAGALWFHTMTYVRTTTVGLLVYIFVLLLVARRYTSVLVGVVALGLFYASSEFTVERYGEIFKFFFEEHTAETSKFGSGRIRMWANGFNYYITRPLMNVVFGLGMSESMTLGKFRLDIHSDYLVLLFGLGPGGLLIYLWIQLRTVLGALWIRANSDDKWARNFATHIIALNALVFVTNLISNSFVTRLTPGWIFMGSCGLLLAVEADTRREVYGKTGDFGPPRPGMRPLDAPQLPGSLGAVDGPRGGGFGGVPTPSGGRWRPLHPIDNRGEPGIDGAS